MYRHRWRAALAAALAFFFLHVSLAGAVEFTPRSEEVVAGVQSMPTSETTTTWAPARIERGDTITGWCAAVLASYGRPMDRVETCWGEVAFANGVTLVSLNTIYPGQIFVLPLDRARADAWAAVPPPVPPIAELVEEIRTDTVAAVAAIDTTLAEVTNRLDARFAAMERAIAAQSAPAAPALGVPPVTASASSTDFALSSAGWSFVVALLLLALLFLAAVVVFGRRSRQDRARAQDLQTQLAASEAANTELKKRKMPGPDPALEDMKAEIVQMRAALEALPLVEPFTIDGKRYLIERDPKTGHFHTPFNTGDHDLVHRENLKSHFAQHLRKHPLPAAA